MATETVTLRDPFKAVWDALDMNARRKAMRTSLRKAANIVKKETQKAVATATAETAHHGARPLRDAEKIAGGVRARIFPQKYGLGFMVDARPKGRKGYIVNRAGKEKPILMWASDGTKSRATKGNGGRRAKRKRGAHNTGRMPAYGFMDAAERGYGSSGNVEIFLFREFQREMEKAARKAGR